MSDIFLVSNTEISGFNHIKVTEISFLKFQIPPQIDSIIITSKNVIKALEFNNITIDFDNVEIFCIGNKSAKFAKDFGFKKIYTSSSNYNKEFIDEIKPRLKDKRILFLRGKDVVREIKDEFNGFKFEQIIAYENRIIKSNFSIPDGSKVVFTSPKNVIGFFKNYKKKNFIAFAIGKTTQKTLDNFMNSTLLQSTNLEEELLKLRKF